MVGSLGANRERFERVTRHLIRAVPRAGSNEIREVIVGGDWQHDLEGVAKQVRQRGTSSIPWYAAINFHFRTSPTGEGSSQQHARDWAEEMGFQIDFDVDGKGHIETVRFWIPGTYNGATKTFTPADQKATS